MTATLSWPARLSAPGPKRILAIDGGGVRGALALGILKRVEQTLRDQSGRPDLVLADYFDLIGGTSTGAIIAGALALGRGVDDLDRLYRSFGARIFRRDALRLPFAQARFDPRRLAQVLREEVGDVTLGSAPWRTGFAAVAKRVDTGSPWMLSNAPSARFWLGDPAEIEREPDEAKRQVIANRHLPLAQVIQSSAAAPFFFDLVSVEVERGKPAIFFDGGITPHVNPSLQLAMAALIPDYGLGWAPGADNLLIVSVGTGGHKEMRPAWIHHRVASIWKAMLALRSASFDSSQLAIAMLQWLGTSDQPWHINSEVGTLQGARPGIEPLWRFVRYDAPLEAPWLKDTLGLTLTPARLLAMSHMDDDSQIPALYDLGLAAGDKLVLPSHFPAAFMPA
jgi:predicted acylesterase/phospholipase RssA